MNELETVETVVDSSNNVDITVSGRGEVSTEIDNALDISVVKKEYKIVGDDVFIPTLYDDAPQWMKDLVQLAVDNAMTVDKELLLNELISRLNDFATSYVPLNQYTQSILDLSNATESIHAFIETLNSNYNDGINNANAQIIELKHTKASSEEVVAKTIETLAAQLLTPSSQLGAVVAELREAVATTSSASAGIITNVNAKLADLDGDIQATANATTYLRSYVGIDDTGTATGTGLLADLSILQKQNDGVIETYTGTYDVMLNAAASPTDDDELVTTAEPYATWKANEVMGSLDTRLAHIGDVYIKYETTASGAKSYIGSYKFIKTVPDETSPYSTDSDGFTWALIIDQAAQDAYVAALNALYLADNKRRVFVGLGATATPSVPYDEGDLWLIDANRVVYGYAAKVGDILRCTETKGKIATYEQNDWVLASSYANAVDAQNQQFQEFVTNDYTVFATNIQSQVDKKAETFYQNSVPTGRIKATNVPDNVTLNAYVGDLWKNIYEGTISGYLGNNTEYVYTKTANGANWNYDWVKMEVPDIVYDTIDTKKSIYSGNTVPVAVLPDVIEINDMWIPSANIGSYKAGEVYIYNGTTWVVATKYTADLEDLDALISVIDPKVDTLQNQVDGKIEYFFFTTYNQAGTVVAGSANEVAALVKVKAQWTTTTAKEQANGNVVYFKDSTNGYWYASATDSWQALTDTSMMQALKMAEDAGAVADEKVAVYFAIEQSTAPAAPNTDLIGANTLYAGSVAIKVPMYWLDTTATNSPVLKKHNGSTWVVVPGYDKDIDKGANDGDQLQTMIVNTTNKTVDYYTREYYFSNIPAWTIRTPNGLVAGSEWGVNLAAKLASGDGTWAAADSKLESTVKSYTNDSVAPLKKSGIVYRNYSTFVIYYPDTYTSPYIPTNSTYPTYAFNAYYGLGKLAVYKLDPETLTYVPADIPISSTTTERLSNLMDFSGTVYKLINISNQYVYQQYITPLVSTDDKYILLAAGDIVEDITGTIWIYNEENLKERKSLWVSKVESSFKYSSVLRVNDNNYITGFSLQSELVDSGNGAAGTSEFVVQADKFKLVDPDNGNNVVMTEEGLVFSDSAGNPYKYLSDIRTAVCTNGIPYTLTNIKKTPTVVLSPRNMPVYNANNSTQNQSVVIDMTDILDNTQTSNTYTFTPRIMLVATDGAITGGISGNVYDSASTTINSSSTLLLTGVTSITLNATVKSVKSTGVSGTYYYRKCVWQLQKSTDAISWTNIGTPVTVNFGASIGSLRVTLNYAGSIAANTYVRGVFVYSNTDGTTFTVGAVPYEYHTLSGSIGTAFAATGNTWQVDSFGTCVLKRSNVTQGSAYYINKTQDCIDTYGSRAGHQYYTGNSIVAPNNIKNNAGFSSWDIYSLTVAVGSRVNTGGSLFLGYSSYGDNAYLLQSVNSTAITTTDTTKFNSSYNMLIDLNRVPADGYYLSDSAVLTYTIELKRVVSTSTTEQNSVYDLSYSAAASGYSALLEGTVNAIMIS